MVVQCRRLGPFFMHYAVCTWILRASLLTLLMTMHAVGSSSRTIQGVSPKSLAHVLWQPDPEAHITVF